MTDDELKALAGCQWRFRRGEAYLVDGNGEPLEAQTVQALAHEVLTAQQRLTEVGAENARLKAELDSAMSGRFWIGAINLGGPNAP